MVEIELLFSSITNKSTTHDEVISALSSLNALSLEGKNWKEITKYQRTLLRLLESDDESIQATSAEILSRCSGAWTKHTIQKVKIREFEISIRQETDKSENGVGWRLWDSSKILSEWICDNRSLFTKKDVLELGSGCGLTGIVASYFAKKVVFSDYIPTLVENVAHNINLNLPPNSKFVPVTEVVQLDWNEIDNSPPQSLESNSFDIIIGSDVTYEGVNPVQLVKVTKKYLALSQHACALFVLPVIRKESKQFVEEMGKTSMQKEVRIVRFPEEDEELAQQFYFCKYMNT
eukprot:Phypoly_transcript_15089.p1 GENE.Phypoly_transcript_15089~~Phypoly_transcript_15089.p1  ORF type:complete len:290 (+),score=51.03 Phypoly_transcript_15089:62-931(+)